MLAMYGVLTRNDDGILCIDDVPVLEIVEKYVGKEVSLSVTELDGEVD